MLKNNENIKILENILRKKRKSETKNIAYLQK